MNSGALLVLFGCASAGSALYACQPAVPARPSTSVTVPRVATSTPLPPERELSVVWLVLDGGEQRSFFLDWGAGKLTVRGERPGAWFVSGDGVYRFKKTSAARASTDCSSFYEPQEPPAEDAETPPPALDLEVNGAVAERVDRPGEIELVALPELENASTFGNSVSLVASAGRFLFIETSSDEYYCGAAHGFRTHGIESFDLERREFSSLFEKKTRDAFRNQEVARHRAEFVTCSTAYAKQLELDPEGMLDDVRLAAIVPRFTSKDGFYLELGWALSVAYAFGTEEWGSYTSGCPSTRSSVPPSIALEPPPRALSELLARHPKSNAGGWSRLPNASDTTIATIDGAFRNPVEAP